MLNFFKSLILAIIFGIGRSVKGLTLPLKWVAKLEDHKWLAKAIFYVFCGLSLCLSYAEPVRAAWPDHQSVAVFLAFILSAGGCFALFQTGYERDENGYKWNPKTVAKDRLVPSLPLAFFLCVLTLSFVPVLVAGVAVVSFFAAYWIGEKFPKHQLLHSEIPLGFLFFIGCDILARLIGGGV